MQTHKTRLDYLQLQQHAKTHPRFVPIPQPQPANCVLPLDAIVTADEIAAIEAAGGITFHAVGDTGGINGVVTQEAVANAMESQFPGPSFFYHLGDVIYYNGLASDYEPQFYEPYKYYPAPIFAIPGNHDGDTHVYPHDPPDKEPSLFGFFTNFCAPSSSLISTYRETMTQPYVYWTLVCPFVTIIGLYGNVDGTLDGRGKVTQEQWLIEQLQQTDTNTCLLVAIHQPPFSLDGSHGGYPTIYNAIESACIKANRYPHAVLSGHVHNYQRFTRTVANYGQIPYIVAGAGGYADSERALHKLRRAKNHAPHPCPSPTSNKAVTLQGYNERDAGFLRITVTTKTLMLEYMTVPFATVLNPSTFDAVTIDLVSRTIVSEMSPGITGAA